MVLPAREAPRDPEPLVFLNGGPGTSSVDAAAYASASLETLRATHDLLLVDMRGTGGSHPLACDLYADAGRLAPYLAPIFPVRRVRECATRLAANTDLTQYTTAAAAEDLDEVRAALGVSQLNLFGASYGTRLALEYMRRHPQRVRRAVLLSPIPANQPLLAAASRSADAALSQAFASCADSEECRSDAPHPRADIDSLLTRLQRAPVTVRLWNWRRLSYESVMLTRRAVAELLLMELYDPDAIRRALPRVNLAVGGDVAPLAQQLARGSQRRRSGRSEGLMLSVMCAEDAPRLQKAASDAHAERLLGNPLVPELLDACREWPTGRVSADYASPVVSSVPTLVIAGGKDPVTPPDLADSTASTLARSERYLDPTKGHASLDDRARARMALFLQCERRCSPSTPADTCAPPQ